MKDIENDVLEAEAIADKVLQLCGEIKAYLTKADKLSGSNPAAVFKLKDAETSEVVLKDMPRLESSVKSKLPKLYLPKFSGDITQFQTFWDSLLRQSILTQACQ